MLAIFDKDKSALPLDKSHITSSVLNVNFVEGYYLSNYETIFQDLTTIAKADYVTAYTNSDVIYDFINNKDNIVDVIIKVEGRNENDNIFADRILKFEDSVNFSTFDTYSENFRDNIKTFKYDLIKKHLWKPSNINNWATKNDVKISLQKILTDYDYFLTNVYDDLYLNACSEEDKKSYVVDLSNCSKNLVVKYKSEFVQRYNNSIMVADEVLVKNPIVRKIYCLSNVYQKFQKNYPKLQVIPLTKRNFEMIALI